MNIFAFNIHICSEHDQDHPLLPVLTLRLDQVLGLKSIKYERIVPKVGKTFQRVLISVCNFEIFDAISRHFKPELKFCVKSCEIRFILDTEHDELKIKRIFENFIKFRSYV